MKCSATMATGNTNLYVRSFLGIGCQKLRGGEYQISRRRGATSSALQSELETGDEEILSNIVLGFLYIKQGIQRIFLPIMPWGSGVQSKLRGHLYPKR